MLALIEDPSLGAHPYSSSLMVPPSQPTPRQHEIRAISCYQSEKDSPGCHLGELKAPPDVKKLADDVQDRTGRQRQAKDERCWRLNAVAHDRAEERWSPGDQAEHTDVGPRRAWSRGKRSGDSESLGQIVQSKTDDEDGGELDRPGVRRLANCQSLREVMQTNPAGDHERKLGGGRDSVLLIAPNDDSIEVDQPEESNSDPGDKEHEKNQKLARVALLCDVDSPGNWFRSFTEDVPEQEDQNAICQRGEKCLKSTRQVVQAGNRQAQKNRQSGECAEDHG